MQQFFGVLSGALALVATIPYARDILAGKTKPHRGSFVIWTTLGSIAFFTQLAAGATWSLAFPALDTFMTAFIALLSIKHGSGGINRRDVTGLTLAAIGLVLWYFTKQPLLALLITIGIDAVGTTLTVLKTFDAPHTETFSAWLLSSLGGLSAALAVSHWSFALLVYPLYIFLANAAVDAAILLGKKRA
jgi:hypothetical protein